MIEDIETSNKAYFDRLKSRDYICACGKAYLSYAALFTHIKQKHQGKPPGNITKPGGLNNKRGRPTNKSKTILNDTSSSKIINFNNYITDHKHNNEQEDQSAIQQDNEYVIQMKVDKLLNEVITILQQIPERNDKKIQLNQIQAFTQMIVVIKRFQGRPSKGDQNIAIYAIIQYLQTVSQRIEWDKFQQLYVLTILFLQFIIDEQNNKNILRTATMDILCQYVNDFMQNHLQAMGQYYNVEDMTILRQDIAIRVFNNIFKWMMIKRYTNYNIEVNGQKQKYYEDLQDSFENDLQ